MKLLVYCTEDEQMSKIQSCLDKNAVEWGTIDEIDPIDLSSGESSLTALEDLTIRTLRKYQSLLEQDTGVLCVEKDNYCIVHSNKEYYHKNGGDLINFLTKVFQPIHLTKLSEAMAKEACTWRYDGLYSVYNLSDWEVVVSNCWELSSKAARDEYFVAAMLAGELIGFGRIQEFDGRVLLGIGLKPDKCGKGYGLKTMGLLTQEALRRYPDVEIGLEVRVFNQRAIKCYQELGFVIRQTYHKEIMGKFAEFHYMSLGINE